MGSFTIPQGDLLPAVEGVLLDGFGEPVQLPDGTPVQFVAARRREDLPIIDRAATVVDSAAGRVRYTWQAGDTDDAGEFLYVWIIEFAGVPNKPQTFPSEAPNKLAITRQLRRAGG